jgi:hypothetical protein
VNQRCLMCVLRLRPDRFAAAAVACVVSAHSSVDATIFSTHNRFDIPAAIVLSQHSRVIMVIQDNNADSVGDLYAFSEKHMGYGPLLFSATFPPSPADIAEFARAQRVGGWVVVQVFQKTSSAEMQWLQDMMLRSADIHACNGSGSQSSSDDTKRIVMHSQFRLWIVSSSASFVPPRLLQSAHVIIHESPTNTFAAVAAAAVEASSMIRDELSPKCSLTVRSLITATALLHALFSFKGACSASLSPGSYDNYPSLPPMRVQISHLLAFARNYLAFRAHMNQLATSQRTSLSTPNSQQSNIQTSSTAVASLSVSSATGNELEVFGFLQLSCSGCGLLMGCCNVDEQKRLTSLAESIFKACGADVTSSNIANIMTLPVSSILAAETCEFAEATNSKQSVDFDCSSLGPDVHRVHVMQQSSEIIQDFVSIAANLQETENVQHSNANYLQQERNDRLMTWLEPSAPHRPNAQADFFWTDTESPNNIQCDSECMSTMKNVSGTAGANEAETKLKLLQPGTPPADFKTQIPCKEINLTMHAVNFVFLSLHEILLALPEPIGIALF